MWLWSTPVTDPYLRGTELRSQRLHLLAQLANDARVGVLVHHGVVDDALGSVGVAQGRQRLLVVVGRGTDRGHHHRLAVAAKIVLKRERQNCFLFNDALNTFYLWLYGIGHMVKDHSDSERGRKEVFYLTTHSTHFIYGYMASDIW